MQDAWLRSHFETAAAAKRFQKRVAQVADAQAQEAAVIRAAFGTRERFITTGDFLQAWVRGGTARRRRLKRERKARERSAAA